MAERSITDILKIQLARSNKERIRRLVDAGAVLAAEQEQIAQALLREDPRFADAITAMDEVTAFFRQIHGEYQAITGHAAEGAETAMDHLHELRAAATVAINLPEIMEAQPIGLEEIPAEAGEPNIEQLVYSLGVRIRRWRQEHPGAVLRVGLVLDGE